MSGECFSLVAQLSSVGAASMQARQQPERHRKGSPYRGSATRLVLDYLRSERVFRRHRDIREALRLSHPSVAWALLYLRTHAFVDVVPDSARNPRYLRYRAKT